MPSFDISLIINNFSRCSRLMLTTTASDWVTAKRSSHDCSTTPVSPTRSSAQWSSQAVGKIPTESSGSSTGWRRRLLLRDRSPAPDSASESEQFETTLTVSAIADHYAETVHSPMARALTELVRTIQSPAVQRLAKQYAEIAEVSRLAREGSSGRECPQAGQDDEGLRMSMINGSAAYSTAAAFRRALGDRLKARAKADGRPQEQLQREFWFQRFLALVFSDPEPRWVLKGGASLLMRLANARFSKDLDLVHLGEVSPTDAIAELRAATTPHDGDHLTFVIEDRITLSPTNPIVEISVTAYIGARYDSFPPTRSAPCMSSTATGRTRPRGSAI